MRGYQLSCYGPVGTISSKGWEEGRREMMKKFAKFKQEKRRQAFIRKNTLITISLT
jgi:hypothetical protein